ncbi:MAG: hypothetical protein MJ025_02385 [Victivallaceae bacterium]|nr:hypothetical protein [Victivallaceae bacterium]
MRIRIVGKNLSEIRPILYRYGFIEDDRDFEMVITHGGDGALLGAERDFPGIPKLPIRDAATARPCKKHSLLDRLEHFRSEARTTTELPKLLGEFNGETLLALNDISLHSADLASALRYRVRIDGELYADEVVGDGVVLSSVHGSTAYYRSITHSMFRVGIGLSFNNSTEEISHLVLKETSKIEVEVLRGPGILVADNDPHRIIVPEGGVISLFQSDSRAIIYDLAEFMCPMCRMIRHPHKHPVPFVQ